MLIRPSKVEMIESHESACAAAEDDLVWSALENLLTPVLRRSLASESRPTSETRRSLFDEFSETRLLQDDQSFATSQRKPVDDDLSRLSLPLTSRHRFARIRRWHRWLLKHRSKCFSFVARFALVQQQCSSAVVQWGDSALGRPRRRRGVKVKVKKGKGRDRDNALCVCRVTPVPGGLWTGWG